MKLYKHKYSHIDKRRLEDHFLHAKWLIVITQKTAQERVKIVVKIASENCSAPIFLTKMGNPLDFHRPEFSNAL